MKINSQLVFALLLQSAFHLSAQENVNRINQFGPALPRITSQENNGSDENELSVKSWKTINESFHEPEAAKVYLHFDRTSFLKGDTIWYKAYLWNGYDQYPDNQSRILYVVLIDPAGKIVQKKKLPVQNGTAMGEFSLENYFKPGSYSICAYTNPAQNRAFGEPFCRNITISDSDLFFLLECNPVFIKNETNDSLQLGLRFYEMDPGGELRSDYFHNVNYSLRIGNRIIRKDSIRLWNTRETDVKCRVPVIQPQDTLMVVNLSIKSGERNINKDFFIPLSRQPDIQFFPEGGSLIYGLESKVAFKVIGQDGLSYEVTGCIRDQNGKELVRFESSHLGMGYFLFTPETGMKYTSYVQFKDIEYQYPLPEPLKEGCVMRLNQNGENGLPEITVNSTSLALNEVKYIAGTSYGKVRFVSEMKINSGEGHFIIPVDSLPEGIARITVLDSSFIPECERLVFVDKSQRVHFTMVADSLSCGKRSKVSLIIKTNRSDWKPVETVFSISVVDAGQVLPDDTQSGIIAYKLLESELTGNIEAPGFYFKDDGSVAMQELDLLLLTQGYRKFSTCKKTIGVNCLDQDTGFNISGKVEIRANQKQKEKYDYSSTELTLMILDRMYFAKTNPDKPGNFKFHIPFVYGKPVVVIQARDPKGKPLQGDITLTMETDEPQFPVILRKDSLILSSPEYVQRLQTSKKVMTTKVSPDVSMFLDLPEVTVKGRNKSMDFNFEEESVWAPNMDSLDPDGYKYMDVFDLLVKEFGAISEIDSATNMIWIALLPSIGQYSLTLPVFLIDGFLVFDGDLTWGRLKLDRIMNVADLPVSRIKKIMVLPPGPTADYYTDTDILFPSGASNYSHDQDLPRKIGASLSLGTSLSMVVIETYPGKRYRGEPRSLIHYVLDGIDTHRDFYSPRYDKPDAITKEYDGRATLYWNPYISTDANGLAKVEFFTSDRSTELIIIVNGIDKKNGNPGQGEIRIKTN